jgi:hypothetical protein
MTAPTGRPRVMRNLLPDAPPRPGALGRSQGEGPRLDILVVSFFGDVACEVGEVWRDLNVV